MRFSPAALLLASSMLAVMSATVATADSYAEAVAAATQQVACAKQEFLLFRRVEFPRQLRQLDATIELAKAEIEMLRLRLREYAPIDKFQTGRALGVTIDATRLHLLDAQQRMAELEQERMAFYRLRSVKLQSLLADVWAAQAQLALLTGGEMVVFEPAGQDGNPVGR
jgi:hypothetical protein